METIDYEWTPLSVAQVRVGLHRFLADTDHGAPGLWELELIRQEREFWLPRHAEGDTPAEVAGWLARQHVDQISKARLYLLDDTAGDLAVHAGGKMRTQGSLPPAPPAPHGLLVSAAGLGYSSDGMELVAVSWGPLDDGEGWWVTWWADMRAHLADQHVHARTGRTRCTSSGRCTTSPPARCSACTT